MVSVRSAVSRAFRPRMYTAISQAAICSSGIPPPAHPETTNAISSLVSSPPSRFLEMISYMPAVIASSRPSGSLVVGPERVVRQTFDDRHAGAHAQA